MRNPIIIFLKNCHLLTLQLLKLCLCPNPLPLQGFHSISFLCFWVKKIVRCLHIGLLAHSEIAEYQPFIFPENLGKLSKFWNILVVWIEMEVTYWHQFGEQLSHLTFLWDWHHTPPKFKEFFIFGKFGSPTDLSQCPFTRLTDSTCRLYLDFCHPSTWMKLCWDLWFRIPKKPLTIYRLQSDSSPLEWITILVTVTSQPLSSSIERDPWKYFYSFNKLSLLVALYKLMWIKKQLKDN